MSLLTKEEQLMYPKVMTERYFKQDSDVRDSCNEMYALETVVNNSIEEDKFYEDLNHEANLVIVCKLPNGVIK